MGAMLRHQRHQVVLAGYLGVIIVDYPVSVVIVVVDSDEDAGVLLLALRRVGELEIETECW